MSPIYLPLNTTEDRVKAFFDSHSNDERKQSWCSTFLVPWLRELRYFLFLNLSLSSREFVKTNTHTLDLKSGNLLKNNLSHNTSISSDGSPPSSTTINWDLPFLSLSRMPMATWFAFRRSYLLHEEPHHW